RAEDNSPRQRGRQPPHAAASARAPNVVGLSCAPMIRLLFIVQVPDASDKGCTIAYFEELLRDDGVRARVVSGAAGWPSLAAAHGCRPKARRIRCQLTRG